MKKIRKKSILIIFSCLVVIILGVIVLAKKDIITFNEIGLNKYLSYSKTSTCNKYFSSYAGQNLIIPYNSEQNNEGYNWYILDGCMVELSYYLTKTEDDVNACNYEREFIQKYYFSSSEKISWYNNLCNSITEPLLVTADGKSCSEMQYLLQNKYANYYGWENWYKTNCVYEPVNWETAKTGYFQDGPYCENVKMNDLYTGPLNNGESHQGFTNNCGYPIYYFNGYATSLQDYKNKYDAGSASEEQFKSICNSAKAYVSSAEIFSAESVNNFNYYCEGVVGKLEVGDFDATQCAEYKKLLQEKYAGHYYLRSEFERLCPALKDTIDWDAAKSGYYKIGNNCEDAKLNNLYTGVLEGYGTETGSGYTNTCGYPIYFYNGYATTIIDYREKYDENLAADDYSDGLTLDVLTTACTKQKEFAKYSLESNTYYKTACQDITGAQNLETCDLKDESVSTLEYGDYAFSYAYVEGDSAFFDRGCGAWSISGILKRAEDHGKLEMACNWFNDLFEAGMLDGTDPKILNGTYEGTLEYTTNCSAYHSYTKTNTSCSAKYDGSGKLYYVGFENERLETCEGVEPKKCDIASEIRERNTFRATKPEDEWANGHTDYILGYIGNYPSADNTYTYPTVVVNGCSRPWALDAIAQNFVEGCSYLQELGLKGYFTKEQIETINATGICHITPTLVGCHVEKDDKNNDIKSIDGYWVNDKTYQRECNSYTVYFNKNAGNILECDNDTTWDKHGQCKSLGTKNVRTEIKVPTGAKTWRGKRSNRLTYWSLNEDCSTIDISAGSNLNIALTSDRTYYACFADNSLAPEPDRYEYTTEDTVARASETVNNDTCNGEYTRLINRNFSLTNYDTSSNKDSFNINRFCKIRCEERFEHTYPSTFKTVKSGTYFEFMYNPNVHGIRFCSEEIDYEGWKTTYNNKLEEENDDYGTYVAARDTYDSLDDAPDLGKSCKSCSGSGENRTCTYWTGYKYKYDQYTYNSYSNTTSSYSRTISSCGGDPKPGKLSSLNWTKNNANNMLKTTVSERKELEKNNRECYGALDNISNLNNKSELQHNYNVANTFILNNPDSTHPDRKINVVKNADIDLNISNKSAYNNSYMPSQTFSTRLTSKPGKTIADFYNINPIVTFRYENGEKRAFNNTVVVDKLKVDQINIFKDTGAYTNWEEKSKDATMETITKTIDGVTITFKAYTATNIAREVAKHFEFIPSKTYYLNNSASTDGKYEAKDPHGTYDTTKYTKLGNVYPVALTTTGTKKVAFALSGILGHKEANSSKGLLNSKLEAVLDANTITNTKHYTCTYTVTNDAVKVAKESAGLGTPIIEDFDKKVRANFYVRSISTTEVDPNDRFTAGTLGTNWADEKGQSLIDIIEEKGKKEETLDPKYLDYSITLTPSSLREINEYNSSHPYSDFNMKCNSVGGECKSTFLTNYVNGKIDGVNVEIGNTMSLSKLTSKREKWWYYRPVGGNYNNLKWQEYLYSSKDTISNKEGALKAYKNDYVNTGVLP